MFDKLLGSFGYKKSDNDDGVEEGEYGLSSTNPAPISWFQGGLKRKAGNSENTTVDACVRLYSQTIATLPIIHQKKNSDGSWTDINNSSVAKLFAVPNEYEAASVFSEAMISSLFYTGNAYIYVDRDNGKFSEMHRLQSYGCRGHFVDDENGRHLIYTANVNSTSAITPDNLVSPLNMLHLKIFPSNHDPLIGMTPIKKAALAIMAANSINEGQANFYDNQLRPSGILSSDIKMNKLQMEQLRQAFKEQAAEMESGGLPILGGGLKFEQIAMSSQDAQLVEAARMNKQAICEAFGIPLDLIDRQKNVAAGTEVLINHWMTTGLAYFIKVIEDSIGLFFGFDLTKERVNFDEKVLSRTLFKDRIAALGVATLHGIYSPDEARKVEGLSKLPNGAGEYPFMQQQMIQIGSVGQQMINNGDSISSGSDSSTTDTSDNNSSDTSSDDNSSDQSDDAKSSVTVDDVLKMLNS